jgi:hypothetical protein
MHYTGKDCGGRKLGDKRNSYYGRKCGETKEN